MNSEMKLLYSKLSTNEKRNELSSLLVKLDKLIDQLSLQNNINNNSISVKNYDSSTQVNQSEDEILTFFYDDVWKIKSKILSILIKNENI